MLRWLWTKYHFKKWILFFQSSQDRCPLKFYFFTLNWTLNLKVFLLHLPYSGCISSHPPKHSGFTSSLSSASTSPPCAPPVSTPSCTAGSTRTYQTRWNYWKLWWWWEKQQNNYDNNNNDKRWYSCTAGSTRTYLTRWKYWK